MHWEMLVSVCYIQQLVLSRGPLLCTLKPCVTASLDYNPISAAAIVEPGKI